MNDADADGVAMLAQRDRSALDDALAQVNALVLGKAREVELAFVALLAGGHLLIEDLPGLGKTTLARAMAASLGLDFQRMQFTADLLPSDILGVSIYDQERRSFTFHPGPIFSQVVLADEINRAPPRTQSALLEAMAEHQVTIDGVCHGLPAPFFVIATQNPVDLAGTFPLPDSQLDRFLLRLKLGYPDAASEREMLAGEDRRNLIAKSLPRLGAEQVMALRHASTRITVSDALIEYIHALVAASRADASIRVGLSPRAGLAVLQAARALALLRGSDYVRPAHVQSLFVEVTAHRLGLAEAQASRERVARSLLASVPVD